MREKTCLTQRDAAPAFATSFSTVARGDGRGRHRHCCCVVVSGDHCVMMVLTDPCRRCGSRTVHLA